MAFIFFWMLASALARVLAYAVTYNLIAAQVPWDVVDAVAQTLVLAAVVKWWKWWLPATVAGGATRSLIVPQLQTTSLLLRWYPAVAVVSAIPQWLVLRRYGRRSLVWLLLPL